MATRSELEMVLGKALMENTFRAWLEKDPEAAAASVGVKLAPEDAKRISTIDAAALDKLAAEAQALATAGGPIVSWGG